MKVLALEKPAGQSTTAPQSPLRAEAARVWELYQAGVLRELYFRGNRTEAVLILECAHVQEAKDILDTLPLVKAGLITFELIPLVPYPGFSRLFVTEA